ncbi:MAG: V-type proton ATPase subunit E [Sphaerochaetaceae bacterium]|nr:V-type proton ATPase subunit E [Sphaerochaetaceae bacterium]
MSEINNPLISDIISKAEKMAYRKITDAEREAEKMLSSAAVRATVERDAVSKTLEKSFSEIDFAEEGEKRNIDRLFYLKSQESTYNEVMKRLDEKLSDLKRDRKKYEKVLIDWAAEAVIGLGRSEALVASCQSAPFTEEMLRKTEALIEKRTGAKVSLSLYDKPLEDFGVALFSTDLKVCYSNRLEDRMHRKQKEIRKIVQENRCKAE